MKLGKIHIIDLAEYMILYFNSIGEVITNKKLNKIIYYIQAWHLALFNDDIFEGEAPEAWVYGPVYPIVYHNYKNFGNGHIEREESDAYDRQKLSNYLREKGFTDDQQEFIGDALRYFGNKSATELEIMTHRERPWLEAREGFKPYERGDRTISLTTMKNYFASRIKKRNE
jgi:uncharacterized phage-associated protein